ncbi:AAA family ATPase [Tabrizicola sp.]|uniref:ATP-dependent nuclease n=1 Tax=Tabrizicola sp. TaxID=2005166 RepID=UPI0025FE81A0|nr:AAA family ATPase [Tabrizicola sp.]MBY0350957.1 ATP-binding protein [Tabrizicola sp.]MDK2774565.1 ATP-binding protein [Tabrizicola sp.]
MQLIKKIEVNYLRSIYSASLDNIGDLNLFFGRNDSGKSNILRALNLFFNDQVEPGQYFDFQLDMSDLRKKKAAEAKGRQFIWIKLTLRVPENYQKSLGEEVMVKKQWNRDGEVTFTSSPQFSGGKSGRLSRFFNEIDFTYIPAIKDISVYADLIERMYASASENSEMLAATQDFILAIGRQTDTLTKQLSKIFGGKAALAPPTDMATLFRNLDFAHGDDGHSLFKQKGDGVKARHLPELLRFINENALRKKFFIWGFEEPENSLDLSAAAEEARRFSAFSARLDTQIFITSHSPAFYLAPSEGQSEVRRFFVEKQLLDDDGEVRPNRAASPIDNLSAADDLMSAAGLLQLPFVIRKLKEQQTSREVLEKEAAKLRELLDSVQRPTLFVEGKHDLGYYPKLLSFYGVKSSIDIRQLGGTPNNLNSFLSAVEQAGGMSKSAPKLFLFDNDASGRSALKAIAGNSANTTGKVANKVGENIFVATLPFDRPSFLDFMQSGSVSPDRIKFPFELMFLDDECLDLIKKHSSKDEDWLDHIHEEYFRQNQKCSVKLLKHPVGTAGWLYARMVPDHLKDRYLSSAFQRLSVTDTFLKDFSVFIESCLAP